MSDLRFQSVIRTSAEMPEVQRDEIYEVVASSIDEIKRAEIDAFYQRAAADARLRATQEELEAAQIVITDQQAQVEKLQKKMRYLKRVQEH